LSRDSNSGNLHASHGVTQEKNMALSPSSRSNLGELHLRLARQPNWMKNQAETDLRIFAIKK
jgi:hypothetical protein